MINFDYPDGATPLDPDEIEGLKLTHITSRSELDRWEQDNILEALGWMESTRPKDILNEQFIRKLHRKMFGTVWKWAGKFRLSDKNIGGPWHQVPIELKNLCDDVTVWIETKQMSPDEMAARLHHRLVSIHPFSNGNGRHARLMADLLLENVFNQPRFTWGSKNLVNASDARSTYISALRAADRFDIQPLIAFARS
jgi:Fic-DOC domain mobile mystery protein B